MDSLDNSELDPIQALKMEFLMCLQKKDFKQAFGYQNELAKLCPGDKTIIELGKFLPDEISWQEAEKAEEEEEEYYDEEDEEYGEESEKSSEEEAEDPTQIKEGEAKKEGAEGEGSDDSESSYYDENGKKVWGEEGDDWDWVHKEDKDTYVAGEAYHVYPEDLLNKNQVEADETEL